MLQSSQSFAGPDHFLSEFGDGDSLEIGGLEQLLELFLPEQMARMSPAKRSASIEAEMQFADLDQDGELNRDELYRFYYGRLCTMLPLELGYSARGCDSQASETFSLHRIYTDCCSMGDPSCGVPLFSWLSLCDDARMTSKKVTRRHMEIIFTAVCARHNARNNARSSEAYRGRRICFDQFVEALAAVAQQRKEGMHSVIIRALSRMSTFEAAARSEVSSFRTHGNPASSTEMMTRGVSGAYTGHLKQLQVDGEAAPSHLIPCGSPISKVGRNTLVQEDSGGCELITAPHERAAFFQRRYSEEALDLKRTLREYQANRHKRPQTGIRIQRLSGKRQSPAVWLGGGSSGSRHVNVSRGADLDGAAKVLPDEVPFHQPPSPSASKGDQDGGHRAGEFPTDTRCGDDDGEDEDAYTDDEAFALEHTTDDCATDQGMSGTADNASIDARQVEPEVNLSAADEDEGLPFSGVEPGTDGDGRNTRTAEPMDGVGEIDAGAVAQSDGLQSSYDFAALRTALAAARRRRAEAEQAVIDLESKLETVLCCR